MTPEEFINEWYNDRDYIVCQTSGSTGVPKEIKLPKTEVERSAQRTIDFFNLSGKSIFYSCVSPEYIGGKMMIVRSELVGTSCFCEEPSNRPRLDIGNVNSIDLLAVVPSQMIHILDHLNEYPKLRNIIIGGSRIPAELRKRIRLSGLNCFETYGMTETASHIALRRVTEDEIPFTTLGDITVESSESLTGKTLAINIPGWQKIITNDLCEVIDINTFRILGRADNVIISGGKKIHCTDVEEKLENLLNHAVIVRGIPHPKWGETIELIIGEQLYSTESKINFGENLNSINEDTIDETIVRKICRENLLTYQQPYSIIFTDRIPRNPNGKKLRQ